MIVVLVEIIKASGTRKDKNAICIEKVIFGWLFALYMMKLTKVHAIISRMIKVEGW